MGDPEIPYPHNQRQKPRKREMKGFTIDPFLNVNKHNSEFAQQIVFNTAPACLIKANFQHASIIKMSVTNEVSCSEWDF